LFFFFTIFVDTDITIHSTLVFIDTGKQAFTMSKKTNGYRR